MSIEIPLDELGDRITEWGPAFVVTVGAEASARAVALRPAVDGDELVFTRPGRSALANAAARPSVTLLFAPHAGSDGFSLIVDGNATVGDDELRVRPVHAVLHRPAPS